jgi:hypothetical protein
MAMLGALPYQEVRDAVLTHPSMECGRAEWDAAS